MITSVEVRRGSYHDSVRLMQASRVLLDLPGVADALVAMATDLNLALLAEMGFDPTAVDGAGPDDLLVAVRVEGDDELAVALSALETELTTTTDLSGPASRTARTIEAAAHTPEANLVLVSVPGPHAFVEAMAALRAGLHVMIFSDNVPVAQEVALKREADRRGLLVMGPDCGTSIVAGVGLGFANVVEPGPVGIAGASGTGIQQLCCLLDGAGVGVRHALGTGSRDLSDAVGGRSTLRAMAALDADPAVEVIVVVSKPPAASVAARVRAAAESSATPVVLAMLGEGGATLEDATGEVLRLLGTAPDVPRSWPAPAEAAHRGRLVGLFSGGTLRDEAALIIEAAGVSGADLVDLGADEYTQGRPHPMIDQRLRIDRLGDAASDPSVAVILLDLVLGHGAHPDPAPELAPGIAEATKRGAAVVVSLCGTRGDPQHRDRQAHTLAEAGASVWLSNAAAARHAAELTSGTRP